MSDLTLLSTLVERVEDERSVSGFTVTRVNLSGEPHAAAIFNAVSSNYNRVLGRPRPSEDDLQAAIGEKVTLILGGENIVGSGLMVAREGRLFESTNGRVAILPKGKRSRGYRVDPEKVIDLLPGWVADEAQGLVAQVRDLYPTLVNLTQERLEQLPREGQGPEVCSLAVFGSNRLFGATECIWLIGEYWPEDDICDRNVMLIRPEFGFSEHGSCYGRDLLSNRALGEIVGFQPITFSEAIALCDLEFDDAVSRVFHQ